MVYNKSPFLSSQFSQQFWVEHSRVVLPVLAGLTLVCGQLQISQAALHLATDWLFVECDEDHRATHFSSFSSLAWAFHMAAGRKCIQGLLRGRLGVGTMSLCLILLVKANYKASPNSRTGEIDLCLDGMGCKVSLQKGMDIGRWKNIMAILANNLPQVFTKSLKGLEEHAPCSASKNESENLLTSGAPASATFRKATAGPLISRMGHCHCDTMIKKPLLLPLQEQLPFPTPECSDQRWGPCCRRIRHLSNHSRKMASTFPISPDM